MPESDLDLLKSAALQAGRIAQGFWREDPQVWDKGGDDPVSEADFAVDSFLHETLLGARPDHAWISEETEDSTDRLSARRLFIVDPIDGTRAFVAGQRTWAHSLAIVHDGAPVAACVYLPAHERMFLAAKGRGATLNGKSIRASGRTALAGASVLAPRVSFHDRFWKDGVPEFDRQFRPSLAYRLALVAQGRFDAMLTLRPAWEWDIAAGALIAAEAGATVSDRHGAPLSFNSPARQTPGAVAAAPALHTALIGRLA